VAVDPISPLWKLAGRETIRAILPIGAKRLLVTKKPVENW
jgi:hypothetical protein